MFGDGSSSPDVTTGPISGSAKVYRDGGPFRRVSLTNGEHVDLYATSGPYTDAAATIDLRAGLPGLRADWVAERAGNAGGTTTQWGYAKAGVITEEMRFVAIRESRSAEFVRAEVAAGRA